ncbi:hypothetical protein ACHAXA_011203 [Cyclostephanos tholiformis]|uniref:DUF423-domain-containing protein n=1 Tax=Cyclostephanos tholiformis TaxID=382380 RepID=A0ABD3RIK1_9STRA
MSPSALLQNIEARMSSNDRSTTLRQLAVLLGASGVGLGAFGAHALKTILAKKVGAGENWKTAVTYQLVHAVALLSLSAIDKKSLRDPPSPSSWSGGKMMAIGAAMFSGSIYCLCLDFGPKKVLGPITPIGGLLLISGWVMVGIGNI